MLKSRRGFTLIELMLVVIVLGILAALALPQFTGARDKAKLAAVKSDVRNAQLAEEAYFSDYGTYGSLGQLQADGLLTISSSNTVFIKGRAGDYLIRVTDGTITSTIKSCSVQVGNGVASEMQGQIACN